MSNDTPPPGQGGSEYGQQQGSYGQGQPPPPGGASGGYGYPSPPPPEGSTTSAKGFIGALFDFSFNSFVTPSIVKIVYVLATIGLALLYLIILVTGFSRGVGPGLLALIVGAVVFFVYLAFVRMTLEFYYAIVRMSEDIHHGRR